MLLTWEDNAEFGILDWGGPGSAFHKDFEVGLSDFDHLLFEGQRFAILSEFNAHKEWCSNGGFAFPVDNGDANRVLASSFGLVIRQFTHIFGSDVLNVNTGIICCKPIIW